MRVRVRVRVRGRARGSRLREAPAQHLDRDGHGSVQVMR